jgi:putative ABC transport system permease protein
MSLLAVKLRRDLRASWSRFVLMVVALAVSLMAFGGMLVGWATIGRETTGAYLATEPASATIVLTEPIDAGRLTAIAAEAWTRPGVLQAAARGQFRSDVAVNGQLRQMPLQVFVATADDPMRMAKFETRDGTWPTAADEILIRQDSLAIVGATIGDTLAITGPNGQARQLRIAGTVYDPSLAPSPQEQRGYAYLATTAFGLDQLKIQVAEPGQNRPSEDRAAVLAVAGEVGAWLQREHGLDITEIQVPRPYAHPHEWQAEVLLLSLLAGGAAALLLSAILVANMLNTLFTQQIPQIGIMKAIGANSGRVGRFYLAMTVLVAGAATLIATLPAILIGQNGLSGLLGVLGIESADLTPPWWTIAVLLGVGLGLPPLMALLPLLKASRITVRAAIDHHGGSPRVRVRARASRLNRGLLMALRNVFRRPARFWLPVSLLASAGMVFIAGMSLNTGTQAVEEQRRELRYWDVDAQLAAPSQKDAVVDAVARISGISQVEAWYRTQVGLASPGQLPFTRTYPDQGHGSVSVNTVPENHPLTPVVLEGRWLHPGETGALVLNQIVRDNTVPDLGAGDQVRLFIDGKPTTWQIVGIIEQRESGDGGVYTTSEGFAAATGQPQRVNQLRAVTVDHDEPTRQATAGAIAKALTGVGIGVTSASSISRTNAASEGHLGPVLLVLLGIAVPMGVVGAIGLASTMSANVLDRTREFGIMHAIGARPMTVRRIVVAEGIFLALTSCVVAALPALGLTAVLGAGLGTMFNNASLPFRVSALAVVIWVVVVTLGAVLATDAAATRASRITVREALAYL